MGKQAKPVAFINAKKHMLTSVGCVNTRGNSDKIVAFVYRIHHMHNISLSERPNWSMFMYGTVTLLIIIIILWRDAFFLVLFNFPCSIIFLLQLAYPHRKKLRIAISIWFVQCTFVWFYLIRVCLYFRRRSVTFNFSFTYIFSCCLFWFAFICVVAVIQLLSWTIRCTDCRTITKKKPYKSMQNHHSQSDHKMIILGNYCSESEQCIAYPDDSSAIANIFDINKIANTSISNDFSRILKNIINRFKFHVMKNGCLLYTLDTNTETYIIILICINRLIVIYPSKLECQMQNCLSVP